jgi:hypothetical protein
MGLLTNLKLMTADPRSSFACSEAADDEAPEMWAKQTPLVVQTVVLSVLLLSV